MKKIFSAVVAAALLTAGAPAPAQEKIPPLAANRAVTVVTGSGPGSSIDTMLRTFIDVAAKYTDQKFTVENRTGGAGIIATNYVLRQPADGFTLFGFTRSYTINWQTQKNMESPLVKYHYVGITMFSPLVLFTYAGSPYKTVNDMIAAGRANPAEQKWGGPFLGAVEWLSANIMWQKLGFKGQYVAFKDGASLNAAVMGKHVLIGLGDMSDIVGRENLLVPLVIAAGQRDPAAPNMPTFKELGYDIVEGNFRGFVTLKDVPQRAKEFYDRLYTRVVADPRWKAYLAENRAQMLDARGPAMEKLCKESAERAAPFIREAGLAK